ncbi:restriction endonuclease subunit S [Thauera phenylacetica]|uniref:restriction endonuclease subunit S n=1 Tax=Thauera phenylacetica TaxID=164400 RepID=UPI0039E4EC83
MAADERNEGHVPVYGSNGVVGEHDFPITKAPAIVIGRKGSSGKLTWSNVPCFPIDTTYFLDETQTREDIRWLLYALGNLDLDKINFDSAVPGLSREYAYSLELLFPPIAEQQRIATYLDASCAAIDAAVAAKRKQIETLDALRAATLQRVITRGLMPEGPLVETRNAWLERIPAGWSLVQLKRLAQVHGGLTLGKSYEGLEVVEYPYLRVANVQDGHLDLTDVTSLEVPPAVAEGVMLRPGDVLMTEGGDLDKLGRGTVWEGQLAPCLHQNHVFAVRCFPHKLLPHFLAYVTASRYGRDYFEATGKRTTNLAATNATKVGAFYIPLPPLAEQKRLVQYLDTEIGRLKAIQEIIGKQIDTLTAYRKSLIHECVTGQRRISAEDLAGVGARLPEAEACA